MGLIADLAKEKEGSAPAGPESVYEEEEGLDPETLNALTGSEEGFTEGFGGFADSVSGDSDRIIGGHGGQAPAGSAGQNPDELLENARIKANSILAEANEEAANIREKAADDGYKEGFDKGMADSLVQYEQKVAELDAKLAANEQEYRDLLASIEPKMVEVITQVYAKVFSMGFYHNQDVLVALISKALLNADTEEKIIIHVSNEDYEDVMAAKDRLFSAASFSVEPQIRPRDSLSSGQAKVETPYGIMDCSIDTELKELEQTLMLLSHT